MGMFDTIFGGNKQATAPAGGNNNAPANHNANQNADPNNPANMQNNGPANKQNTKTAPNGLVPDNSDSNQNQDDPNKSPVSPLDKFGKLWETEAVDPKAPIAKSPFEVDPEKIFAAAKRTDFSKVIKPENLKKIVAGGDEAAQAFMETINDVGQHIYGHAAMAATRISEHSHNLSVKRFESDAPGLIKRHTSSQAIREANPAFKHPAVQPMIAGLAEQLRKKNPEASDSELTSMATEFVGSFVEQFTPKKEVKDTGISSDGSQDFSKFLE